MKINKFLLLAVAATSIGFTACMEETEPTDAAIDKQVAESPSSADGLLMAMPAYANSLWMPAYNNNWHNCFGLPALMHIRDCFTGDQHVSTTTYASHFYYWTRNKNQGDSYLFGQFFWNYYYAYLMTVNNLLQATPLSSATDQQKEYHGMGLAFRAMLYLDMARMYEFKKNDGTESKNKDGNDVLGYTVPIVTEGMAVDVARSNPRANVDEMFNFIENDLKTAEEIIPAKAPNKTLPNIAVVYGLEARLYMWYASYKQDLDSITTANNYFKKAFDAANNAIATADVQPMTEEQLLNESTGMNTLDPWMWGCSTTAESDVVQTGIINWPSWMSNQTTFGYTGPSTGLYQVIDKKMYERIGDNDIRKAWFKAPQDRPDLGAKNRYTIPAMATWDSSSDYYCPAYTALKFRPGSGNADDYVTGAQGSVPFMRVEEMYFIQAEAAAQLNAADGKDLLVAFMQNYRNKSYSTLKSSKEEIVEEIVFQKRVELWGEGQAFFDIKRLNLSVTRGYDGTNCADDLALLNTNGRPAWMNLVIVKNEENNNKALVGWNNPDPTDAYTPWVRQ